jgi:hypothetical protein
MHPIRRKEDDHGDHPKMGTLVRCRPGAGTRGTPADAVSKARAPETGQHCRRRIGYLIERSKTQDLILNAYKIKGLTQTPSVLYGNFQTGGKNSCLLMPPITFIMVVLFESGWPASRIRCLTGNDTKRRGFSPRLFLWVLLPTPQVTTEPATLNPLQIWAPPALRS